MKWKYCLWRTCSWSDNKTFTIKVLAFTIVLCKAATSLSLTLLFWTQLTLQSYNLSNPKTLHPRLVPFKERVTRNFWLVHKRTWHFKWLEFCTWLSRTSFKMTEMEMLLSIRHISDSIVAHTHSLRLRCSKTTSLTCTFSLSTRKAFCEYDPTKKDPSSLRVVEERPFNSLY